MIYINDPQTKFVTYDEAVEMAIKAGIKPKRAYLYLAGLGVKGAQARINNPDTLDYYAAQKIAVMDSTVIKSIKVCTKCKGLSIII
jgi:hypothetical protein